MGREKYPEAEIRLFGSQARGDAGSESDWDFLIIMPENRITYEKEREVMAEFFKIELETGEIITPYIIPRQYWVDKGKISPLFRNIKNEGIRLQ